MRSESIKSPVFLAFTACFKGIFFLPNRRYALNNAPTAKSSIKIAPEIYTLGCHILSKNSKSAAAAAAKTASMRAEIKFFHHTLLATVRRTKKRVRKKPPKSPSAEKNRNAITHDVISDMESYTASVISAANCSASGNSDFMHPCRVSVSHSSLKTVFRASEGSLQSRAVIACARLSASP